MFPFSLLSLGFNYHLEISAWLFSWTFYITSRHYFVRATANNFNSTTNETFYTESVSGVKRIIPGLATDPKTFITTVGLYNGDNELLAIAKLSRPIIKSKSREALIKVKLDF